MGDGGLGTAVVIGGSVAGSFAARVLADRFDRVLVFDKDELPAEPVPRHGAMQGVHFHALLARGRMMAEELFPGFGDELIARGAAVVDASDAHVYEPYGWGPRRAPGRTMIGASRLLIELVLRERARVVPGVEVRTATEVIELLAPDGRDGGITGVRVRDAGGVRDVPADLVVDASGRAGVGVRALAALGWPEPETTTVNAHWGYASRFVRLPDGIAPPVVGGFPIGDAGTGHPRTRGGFLLLQENDTWLVTLSGCAKDFPPGDEDGFLAYARTLAFPHIGEVLPHAEPMSPIRTWRNTINRRRHFERLPERPEGFVAIADAACAFNPIYGQGMTIASLAARDLAIALDDGVDGAPGRFATRHAETIAYAWDAACRADFRVPGAEGDEPPVGYLDQLAYYDRVVALSRDDLGVYEKISATNQLVLGPEWLDDPELRARVQARWDELGAVMGCTRARPR